MNRMEMMKQALSRKKMPDAKKVLEMVKHKKKCK